MGVVLRWKRKGNTCSYFIKGNVWIQTWILLICSQQSLCWGCGCLSTEDVVSIYYKSYWKLRSIIPEPERNSPTSVKGCFYSFCDIEILVFGTESYCKICRKLVCLILQYGWITRVLGHLWICKQAECLVSIMPIICKLVASRVVWLWMDHAEWAARSARALTNQ
jgi:hypothetical protein